MQTSIAEENVEDDIDMISFRKTNTSVDENDHIVFGQPEYILVTEDNKGWL